jgi:hypothetical protein
MERYEVQPMAPDTTQHPPSRGGLKPAPVDRRCSATVKATGAPCTARPLAGQTTCWMHSQRADVAEKRHLARVAGGLRTNKAAKEALAVKLPPADLSSAEGIRRMLQDAADAVRDGRIAPSVANSLAQLASVSLRLVELSLDIEELRLTQQALDEPTPVGGGFHGVR